jgi:uncharacterized membrane protein
MLLLLHGLLQYISAQGGEMEKQIEVLDWIAQGRVVHGRESEALALSGFYPATTQWRRFIDQMLLWCGVIALGAALIFFLAYNWQAMGRYAKFALAEGAVLLSLLVGWRFKFSGMAGKSSLLLASLFVGALLALVGQTYQTGADTYELFSAWAIATLAWVVLAQLGALYLFWLALVNMAVMLYFQTFGGFWGMVFSTNTQIWSLFVLNTLALFVWEFAAWRGVQHLRERWSVRVLATASGVLITMLALNAIFEGSYRLKSGGYLRLLAVFLVYLAWLLATFIVYRKFIKDLFVLAGGVLSLIVSVNALVGRTVLHHSEAGGFLLVGLLIIASSAWGGIWLKNLAKEMQA